MGATGGYRLFRGIVRIRISKILELTGLVADPAADIGSLGKVIDRWAYDLYGPTDKEVGAMVDV